MNDIIYIDDIVTEDSLDGQKVKSIVESKNYSIRFINKKSEIDELLASDLNAIKLVLLDLDLSGIEADAEEILTELAKKRVKVIILSGLPKTSDLRKKRGLKEYQQNLPCMNRLYNKGALSYILKSEMDEKKEFVANVIDRMITDPNNSGYTLILDCELAQFSIINKDSVVVEKNLSDAKSGWMVSSQPSSAIELILRLLFEMGKEETRRVKISNFYPEASKLNKDSEKSFRDSVSKISLPQTNPNLLKIKKFSEGKNHISKKEVEELIKELIKDMETYMGSNEKINSKVEESIKHFIDISSAFEYSTMMPKDYQKILGSFNDSIRDKSNGLFVGRLLQGGGHGDRSGIYMANIERIELKNSKEDPVEPNWKETIEKRLVYLENELTGIKKKLTSK